jgi:hypothetical protein
MGQNGGHVPMKEIKNAIIEALKPDPQFVDSIPENIGFRSPQFMAKLRQTFDLDPALYPGFG